MRVALYPGSFDPITLGHLDVIERASKLFDRLIIAVATNTKKAPYINASARIDLIKACTQHLKNVDVTEFNGLTIQFAKASQAQVIIRGLRAVSDFEFEFKMSQMNKSLDSSIETLFMMAGLDYQFLSSSLVKEVAQFGGDISKAVPAPVAEYLKQHHPPPALAP